MSLIAETGAGIQGAESYAATAFIDAYWTARTQSAFSAAWTAATTAKKEGAAREATAYIDAVHGPFYRGIRKGYVQGLLFPRTNAFDDAGYPLPDLPACLQQAVAELAGRAISAALASDTNAGSRIKAETVGALSTEYFDVGANTPKVNYGIVADLLAQVLNGSQPNAPNAKWGWA